MYRETFVERLRAAIGKAGISQADLARAAGVTPSTITLWMTGRTDVDRIQSANLAAAAEALGVTPEWLRGGSGGLVLEAGSAYGTDGLGRIVSWSNPAELPPDRYVVLPRLAAFLSAGNGGTMDGEPEPHQTGQAFRSDFIAKMGWRVDTHYTLRVRGDSMSPTIPDGSSVVIDVSQRTPVSGSIYAVRVGEDVRLKRLFVLPNGLIRVASDNPAPAYAAIDASPDDLRVIGRAVHLATLL